MIQFVLWLLPGETGTRRRTDAYIGYNQYSLPVKPI
jgi:hypothetical protein